LKRRIFYFFLENNIKKSQSSEQVNEWSVIGSGRWTRLQQRNPNEQDHEERKKELELLPDDQRAEVLFNF